MGAGAHPSPRSVTMNRGAIAEERTGVGGRSARYLTAGEGQPLVLVHALGETALEWSWVLPALSRDHRPYSPDLPGITGDGGYGGGYSPASFASFLAGFLDVLGIERAAIVGNSLRGLVALRLALSDPARVSALSLVDSAGLGRTVSYALRAPTLAGYGELAIAWSETPPGAAGRAWMRANLLFAHPHLVPDEWLAEQRRLALRPGFLEAALAALRAHIAPGGQREVLLGDLRSLTMPTHVVWGSATASSRRARPRTRQTGSRRGAWPSFPTAATFPRSSVLTASRPSSAGSSMRGDAPSGSVVAGAPGKASPVDTDRKESW